MGIRKAPPLPSGAKFAYLKTSGSADGQWLCGFTYDTNVNMTVLTNPVDVDHGFGFNTVNLNSSYHPPFAWPAKDRIVSVGSTSFRHYRQRP